MAGEITIPLAKIKELRTAGKFALLRKDTKTPRNAPIGTISYEDGDLIVAAAGGPERVPAKNVDFLVDQTTYENEVHPPKRGIKGLAHGWSGSLTGGVTAVQSAQHGATYTAAAALVREIPTVSWLPPKDRTIFGLTETYGKLTQKAIPQANPPIVASVVKTDIFHAGLEQDRYLTPRVYALGSMAFDHDYAQGLNLQQVYGGGIGWTAIKDAVQELDVKGQLQYERQSFQTPSSDQNLIGATIGESYMRKLPRSADFQRGDQCAAGVQ